MNGDAVVHKVLLLLLLLKQIYASRLGFDRPGPLSHFVFVEAEGCTGATMGERLTAMGERMMRSCGNGRVDYRAA